RAGAGAAAGYETADRHETRTDTASERRGNAGIFEIELGVADLRLGVVDCRLRRVLLGRALIDRLGRCETAALKRLRAAQLAVGERQARGGGLQIELGAAQLALTAPL